VGGLKKRRKDSFLTLISNTYLFIIPPANNIIYANKGCNDILFDNIILWGEFKSDNLPITYISKIYMYMSINKRFTTTLFYFICCNASPELNSAYAESRRSEVSWVIDDPWRKPCPYPFSEIIGYEQFMGSVMGCLETTQPNIIGVM